MKRYFVIIFLVLILLGLAGSCWAYITIIKDYPELPACKDNKECRPGQEGFGLPEFVKYIFIFSLGIVGIIGLLAIIIAAFGYVTSVGNPQKAAEAKDKIISALLGLLLLLGSWVLLNLINPDLLKLGINVEPLKDEVKGNGGTNEVAECQGAADSWTPSSINEGENSTYYINLTNTCKDIPQGSLLVGWKAHLWQENVAERQSGRCGNFTRNMLENRIEVVCQFKNVTDGLKNSPERFYMEGSIEINKHKMNVSKNTNILVTTD